MKFQKLGAVGVDVPPTAVELAVSLEVVPDGALHPRKPTQVDSVPFLATNSTNIKTIHAVTNVQYPAHDGACGKGNSLWTPCTARVGFPKFLGTRDLYSRCFSLHVEKQKCAGKNDKAEGDKTSTHKPVAK